jgi:uncharacterized protein YjbJ (UPF0337 family)
MNTDQTEGKWEQVKGRFKEIWSDLTDSDLRKMKGSMQEAIGYLQEKYGDTKEAIEEKINDWINQNKKE